MQWEILGKGKIEHFSLSYGFWSSELRGERGDERVFVRSTEIVISTEEKTPLRCLPDAIMLLTFFDAVVIAIATCSYRDSNMMLSTCVHVVIKLATCCQFEGTSFLVDEEQGEVFCERKNRTLFFELRVSEFGVTRWEGDERKRKHARKEEQRNKKRLQMLREYFSSAHCWRKNPPIGGGRTEV